MRKNSKNSIFIVLLNNMRHILSVPMVLINWPLGKESGAISRMYISYLFYFHNSLFGIFNCCNFGIIKREYFMEMPHHTHRPHISKEVFFAPHHSCGNKVRKPSLNGFLSKREETDRKRFQTSLLVIN